MVCSRKFWTLGCVISASCFTLSVIILAIFPTIYKFGIAKMTNLVQGSFLYPLWRDLPLPIYKRLYFFNITNAAEFLLNGTSMEVDEVGPYTYVGRWIKEDISWDYEGAVSYREVKTFHFARELSVGDESDEIYSLNGPYIVAADIMKDSGSVVRRATNRIFRFLDEELIVKKSIQELAFGGYKDPLMRYGKYYRWNTPFKNGKFSWLAGHNATDDGIFQVSTGEVDHSTLNMIKEWNGDSYLDFWKNDSCNKITGTNVEFGPPLKENQTEYTFFQPIFCRSVTFRGNETVIHNGIGTRRFENHEDIFSKENPDNDCFDISPELKSGVLDIRPCQFEAPVVLSFPHFYLADSSYLENIVGLEPKKEYHGSHIDAEILTGVSVDISIKFQMNIRLEPVEHLTAFKNATAGVYPVFWLDLKVSLPDDLIQTIHYQLYRPKSIVHGLVAFAMVLSVIFFVISIWNRGVDFRRENLLCESKPLIEKDSHLLNHPADYSKFKLNFSMSDSTDSDLIKVLENSYSFEEDDEYEINTNAEICLKFPKRTPKDKYSQF